MNNTTDTRTADAPPGSLERLVRRLYEARQDASAAKKARAELAAKLGSCDGRFHEEGCCYQNSRMPKDDWCDICKAKLPVWEDYQRKATAAGAALRDVIRAGKRMTPNDPSSATGREQS
jgi:hypothetical protein